MLCREPSHRFGSRRLVGILMELEPVLSNDSADFCSIQDEQYRAKDRSLWDPSGQVEQLVD